jgi:hypothetical protein
MSAAIRPEDMSAPRRPAPRKPDLPPMPRVPVEAAEPKPARYAISHYVCLDGAMFPVFLQTPTRKG